MRGSRFGKIETYSVPADREQVLRWQAAAELAGQRVGDWLADTADRCLSERARTGALPPLSWFSMDFRVAFVNGEREIRGFVSGCFAVFRGDHHGPGELGSGSYSLVHLPTRRIMKTLSLRKACMALAAELSALCINWQEKDPEKVLGEAPDKAKAQKLIRLFERLTDPY